MNTGKVIFIPDELELDFEVLFTKTLYLAYVEPEANNPESRGFFLVQTKKRDLETLAARWEQRGRKVTRTHKYTKARF